MKYVKIKSIKACDSEPVYHMVVQNNHNFFANNLLVHNCGYRGEVQLTFNKNGGIPSKRYEVGERVGQIIIMPYPEVEFVELDNLTETVRGEGGFGSSGK
jgi:dUTP pyrophosphatase